MFWRSLLALALLALAACQPGDSGSQPAVSVRPAATAAAEEPSSAGQEKRLALVLSNEDYPDTVGRLAMAHSDGDLMTEALESIRFQVTRGSDLNSRETRAAVNAFIAAINEEAANGYEVIAFVYVAMHGAAAEFDGGMRNFLIPAKEEIATQTDLTDRGYRLDVLVHALDDSKAKAVVIVSDACRNTLKLPTTNRSVASRGFVSEPVSRGMLIAYATQLGEVTPDNGEFARILSREITRTGQRGNYAMLDALSAASVSRQTDSQPFMTGGLPRSFCFNGCPLPRVEVERTLSGHTGPVWSASYSRDGSRIVTASSDTTARVWNADTGEVLATLSGHTGWVRRAVLSPDGQLVATGSQDGTARLWNATDGRAITTLVEGNRDVNSVAFSPDGSLLAIAADYGVDIVDVRQRKVVGALAALPQNADHGVDVSDLRKGKVLILDLPGIVQDVAFSPDGALIATASQDDKIRLWDVATRKLVPMKFEESPFGANSVAFSSDGGRIVVGGSVENYVLNARTGATLFKFDGHKASVYGASFSPDGKRMATASFDGSARLWDVASHESIAQLPAHTDVVTGAVFSPDGTRILTSSADMTAKIWRIVE